MLPMSSLSVTLSALPDILAALHRPRPRALSTPLIDAPFTHSALTNATSAWTDAAHRHAEAREAHFSEAARFLRAVATADEQFSERLR